MDRSKLYEQLGTGAMIAGTLLQCGYQVAFPAKPPVINITKPIPVVLNEAEKLPDADGVEETCLTPNYQSTEDGGGVSHTLNNRWGN